MNFSTKTQITGPKKQGSKAAVIRPINRRDGKQSYVRIDSSHASSGQPNFRAQQLEDYVAQIRNHSEDIDHPDSINHSDDATSTPETAPQTQASADSKIIEDISVQQRTSNLELTSAEHLDALRVVAKIDAGYHWIANNNRNAALESLIIGDNVAALPANEETEAESKPRQALQPKNPENTADTVSAKLVQDIATAIASVLTENSEKQLSEKLISEAPLSEERPSQAETLNVQEIHRDAFEKEQFRLEPELPRPGYSLPVIEHSFPTREVASDNSSAEAEPESTRISLTAAAWDVDDFRWPEVTDKILSNESMLSALAQNCISMLSPFGKTIAVTAPDRHRGTSTLAITLARLIAGLGNKVLLVDADITNPSMSREIGIAGVNWFNGQDSMEPAGESIVYSHESGICVMAQSTPIERSQPHGTPVYDMLERQLDQVRSEFDFIVLDAGPSQQIVDEMSTNSHLIDAAMLVNDDVQSPAFVFARESLIECGVFKFIAAQNNAVSSRAA
jgi:hypothetical protein